MQQKNLSRLYAGVVGATLVLAGVVGFFYDSTFTSDKSVHDAVFGILDVNGWHNLVHIATGLLGLAAFAAGARASRTYALIGGAVYIVVAIWGFIIGDGDSILSIIPINTEDSVLHLAIGLLGVAVGVGEGRQLALPASTRAA